MNYIDYKNLVESISGRLCEGQEEFLFNIVKELPENSSILEIGSWHGRSSAAIGFACKNTNKRLYCIDRWKGHGIEIDYELGSFFNVWNDNMKRLDLLDIITPIQGESDIVLTNLIESGRKFDFIFIDGSHKYENVLIDFIMSYQLLKKNGILGMHDVNVEPWIGVRKVWNEIAIYLLVDIRNSSSLYVGKKVDVNKVSSRITQDTSYL